MLRESKGWKEWEVVRFRKYFEGSIYKIFCLVDFKETEIKMEGCGMCGENEWLTDSQMSPQFLDQIPGKMVLSPTKMKMSASRDGFGESSEVQF